MSSKIARVEYIPHPEVGDYSSFFWVQGGDTDLPSAIRALKRAQFRFRLAEEQEEAGWVHIRATDFSELQDTVKALRKQVGTLNSKIRVLERQRADIAPTEVVEFRTMPHDEAKVTILEYVKSHPDITTSRIIEDLKIDPMLTSEILDELAASDELEASDVHRADEA